MATRETTREEDLAYCLLGIFEVNMPLLYGEGQRAFTRLQEMILMQSDDQSIFCWVWDSKFMEISWGSILAPCPAVFARSGHFGPAPIDINKPIRVYKITNSGLSIWLPFILTCNTNLIFAVLQVVSNSPSPGSSHFACIPLNRLRIHCRTPFPAMPVLMLPEMAEPEKKVYIKCKPTTVPRTSLPSKSIKAKFGRHHDQTTPETLANRNNFGVLFVTKPGGKNTLPNRIFASKNATQSIHQNLVTFSFSGQFASETSAFIMFQDSMPGRNIVSWLAIRTSLDLLGTRQHNLYCGTEYFSWLPKSKPKTYEHIAVVLQTCPEQELKDGKIANSARVPAVVLGERIMYSSTIDGYKNAQVAHFCDRVVENDGSDRLYALLDNYGDVENTDQSFSLSPLFSPFEAQEDDQSFGIDFPDMDFALFDPMSNALPDADSALPGKTS